MNLYLIEHSDGEGGTYLAMMLAETPEEACTLIARHKEWGLRRSLTMRARQIEDAPFETFTIHPAFTVSVQR